MTCDGQTDINRWSLLRHVQWTVEEMVIEVVDHYTARVHASQVHLNMYTLWLTKQ